MTQSIRKWIIDSLYTEVFIEAVDNLLISEEREMVKLGSKKSEGNVSQTKTQYNHSINSISVMRCLVYNCKSKYERIIIRYIYHYMELVNLAISIYSNGSFDK